MTASAPTAGAGEPARLYLGDTFAELCRIESPSGREQGCADRVIAELQALGVDVQEDTAGALGGSPCGNLLARIAGEDGGPSVLLCAHLDTAPLQAPVEPALIDGCWQNSNEGILGADNKAAVAVLLALAGHVRREGAPADVELLFTVGQETTHPGARSFDASRLRSNFGYAFDHCGPIGQVILDAPSSFRIEAAFRGAAAHAGARPQVGRSAILAAARAIGSIRVGRLDDQTTVNVGSIVGGDAADVVPAHCALVGEIRSLSDERAEALVAEMVAALHAAANLPECDCDVDISVQRTSCAYRLPATTLAVRAAEAALRGCGHEPVRISSGGTSPANGLLEQGIPVVNLANGTECSHEPDERVSAAALEEMLDVALGLLGQVAAYSPDAAL